MLGIGIVSYNRLALVKRAVERIRRHTAGPYALVVADDGSTDGTQEWVRSEGVPLVAGKNHGCAWNKNRALYHLMHRTAADVLVLIEDDTHPNRDGWDATWADAVRRWGHVNVTPDAAPTERPPREGKGTVAEPYWVNAFWGNCSGFRRDVIDGAGYLDPHFRGYGWEHVEHTWRCSTWLRNRVEGWLGGLTPCLSPAAGVVPTWDGKSYHPGDKKVDAQLKVYEKIKNDPLPRPAYLPQNEREFLEEQAAAQPAIMDTSTASVSVPAISMFLAPDPTSGVASFP